MTAETVEETPVEPEEVFEEWPEEDFGFDDDVEPSLSLWRRFRDWLGSFRRRDDDYIVTAYDALVDHVVAQRKLSPEDGRVALLQVAALLAPSTAAASDQLVTPSVAALEHVPTSTVGALDDPVQLACQIAASRRGQPVEPPSILDLGELTPAQKAALVVRSFGLNPNNLN